MRQKETSIGNREPLTVTTHIIIDEGQVLSRENTLRKVNDKPNTFFSNRLQSFTFLFIQIHSEIGMDNKQGRMLLLNQTYEMGYIYSKI